MPSPSAPGPPPLPAGAPAELADFVACRRGEVDLAAGKVRWLPAPPGIREGLGRFLAPRLAIAPGGQVGQADLSVGWGVARLWLTATVTDGSLRVEPVGWPLPGLTDVVAGLDGWAAQLNAWLHGGGWRLGPPTIVPGRLTLRKERLDAA